MTRVMTAILTATALLRLAAPLHAEEPRPGSPALLPTLDLTVPALSLSPEAGMPPPGWRSYELGLRLRSAGIVLAVLGLTHILAGSVLIAVDKTCAGDACGALTGPGVIVVSASLAYGVPGAVLWSVGQARMDRFRPADYPAAPLAARGRKERLAGIIITSLGAAAVIIGGVLFSAGSPYGTTADGLKYNAGFFTMAAGGPFLATIGLSLLIDGQLRISEAQRFPGQLGLAPGPAGAVGASLRWRF
jgi:hypothetical protein